METQTEVDDLNRFSRAGDAFHYRWAARRCLNMIHPNSEIGPVVIEGSLEKGQAGEYVIDVAEYKQDQTDVTYYQLKHSTKRLKKPIKLSDVKSTIHGFSQRFKAQNKSEVALSISAFTLLTNRPICNKFKENITKLAKGDTGQTRFLTTLKSYTKLSGSRLTKFCSLLILEDGEGNYLEQRFSLQRELSELVAGVVDNPKIDTLIELVASKALPDNQGEITREEVLQRLGANSSQSLFPAPAEFEELADLVPRSQHSELLRTVIDSADPIIIHAEGGVGKTVICRQLANSLPIDWKYVIYDCFGSGKYRSRSQPRHRYRDAITQISNELAELGLCEPLVTYDADLEDALLRAFKSRLQQAVDSIRKKSKDAQLVVFIDAADNAEMAAKEFSESCFATQFLREDFPKGCKIVSLCRTERINYLSPNSHVKQILLRPFDQRETYSHALKYVSEITEDESIELHRLTGGNPRVQANGLSMNLRSIADVLEVLGPSPTSVDQQINEQLEAAVTRLKEAIPDNERPDIENICYGLANLPPFIPLNVLASAANVSCSLIKSFISDLGRPLWLSEESVMFRDEPTESWFIRQFSASEKQVQEFVNNIKAMANNNTYVAEALPLLLLKAGLYTELVELSLSNDLLPENPIEARNIRMYRLQFAFKAALKKRSYVDLAKLAMLAGEEVSSDNRQFELLAKNLDLIRPLQSRQRVQEIAFKQELAGDWMGSENIYSASLLSSESDCKGEARAYLRAANNWLQLFFKQREEAGNGDEIGELKISEIVELIWAQYNLSGAENVSRLIFNWKPADIILEISAQFFSRLVDSASFDEIEKVIDHAPRDDLIRYQYLCVSATSELWEVNRTLQPKTLRYCLSLLLEEKPIEQKNDFVDPVPMYGLISFAEACAHRKISKVKIRKLLKIHVLRQASYSVYDDHFRDPRNNYLRGISLDMALAGKGTVSVEKLLPDKLREKDQRLEDSRQVRNFKEMIGGLLPWHLVRAKCILGITTDLENLCENASRESHAASSHRYGRYDTLPSEISNIRFQICSLHPTRKSLDSILEMLSSTHRQFILKDRLTGLRLAARSADLSSIIEALENDCHTSIINYKEGSPEDTAGDFIKLARAVLPIDHTEAAAYFDFAVEVVSKFGDEITERWYATSAVARRFSEDLDSADEHEFAYRFSRCTELVGSYVAREKYINRNEAVRICASISPSVAISAVSRWRDRDIGWFDEQVKALLRELMNKDLVSPSVAWSCNGFNQCRTDLELISWCLNEETCEEKKQLILDTATRHLLINENSKEIFQNLASHAKELHLSNTELEYAAYYHDQVKKVRPKKTKPWESSTKDYATEIQWNELFEDLDLLTSQGISAAVKRYSAFEVPRYDENFWQEYFNRISAQGAAQFFQEILNVESVGRFDMERALEKFPSSWRSRASVKKVLPGFLKEFVSRYAINYSNIYAIDSLATIVDDSELESFIHIGVIDGLSKNAGLFGARTYFSFAQSVTAFLTGSEARDVLDSSLSRFELYIDEDFGDGKWEDWLEPADVVHSITGLIWSALGSPNSKTRWEAVHCVKNLVEMGCLEEINALMEWMKSGVVDAFGCREYPFYDLHAKQYLLIGLCRAAVDSASHLLPHKELFFDLALNSSHVLIQHYSCKIALCISGQHARTYSEDETKSLENVNKSLFPEETINIYEEPQTSPWHRAGEVNTNLNFRFSWDFDRYWYEPLGRVFGISSEQVQELAREVVAGWGSNFLTEYVKDARKDLWSDHYEYKNTSHSHGSYPEIDTYSFYVSYHVMMIVAEKLLRGMPVVKTSEWIDDGFENWLERHLLTRSDGKWLADRRDPSPLEQRAWLVEEQTENWRWEICPADFLVGLIREESGSSWLNVYGHWNDCNSSQEEAYYITSALVSVDTSQSLLRALTTCKDPHDYKLPNYLEDRMEHRVRPFQLEGWIEDFDMDKRIDKFDPHAGDFYYPTPSIGEEIAKKLELSHDGEHRFWFEPTTKTPIISNFTWGDRAVYRSERYVKRGQRTSASLSFLKHMCEVLDRELIIEVQINRSVNNSYTRDEDDEIKYSPSYSKVYLLGKDGILRDTRTSYKLREKVS